MKKILNKKLFGVVLTVLLVVCALPATGLALSNTMPSPSPAPMVSPTPKPKTPIQIGSEFSKVYDGKEISHSDVLALLSSKSGTGVTKFSYTWYNDDGDKMSDKPVNAGEYKLKIKVSDKDPVYTGSTTVTYKIDKRPLEWDLTGLTAHKFSDGTVTPPDINGDLKVSGFVEGDDVKLVYESITAPDFPSAEVQQTSLALTVSGAKLEGKKADNYTLPSDSPKVNAAITKAYINEVSFEGNNNKYRTVVEESVYTSEALMNTEYKTETAIMEAMRAVAGNALKDKEQIDYTFYTAKMQIWQNGEWVDVTAETNPMDGAPVVLPYPEGTQNNSHEFIVYRMKTFDEDAGTIEVWAHTEKVEGLEITLSQGEPVLVAYSPKPFNTGIFLALGGGAAAILLAVIFFKLLKKDREETAEDKLDNGTATE